MHQRRRRCICGHALVWYILGSISAASWIKFDEWDRHRKSKYFGACYRPSVSCPAAAADCKLPYENGRRRGGEGGQERTDWMGCPLQERRSRSIPWAINRIPNATTPCGVDAWDPDMPIRWGPWKESSLKTFAPIGERDEEYERQRRERLLAIRRKAYDSCLEWTEKTLDMVCSATVKLKTKLAEHRAKLKNKQEADVQDSDTPDK